MLWCKGSYIYIPNMYLPPCLYGSFKNVFMHMDTDKQKNCNIIGIQRASPVVQMMSLVFWGAHQYTLLLQNEISGSPNEV